MKQTSIKNKEDYSIDNKGKKKIHVWKPITSNNETYKFYLGSGNNGELIRRIINKRKCWQQISDSKYLFLNLKWQQTIKGYKYSNSVQSSIIRQSLNHFENHHQLSNKEYLFKNLSGFCFNNQLKVFDYIPVTFILNTNDLSFQVNQNNFLHFFWNHKPAHLKQQAKSFLDIKNRKTTYYYPQYKNRSEIYCQPELQQDFISENSQYLWLLKPTFYNRGDGIHVFNEIKQLQKLMNLYIVGTNKSQTKLQNNNFNKFRIRNSISTIKTSSFVVQKYLEKPLLLDGRKFDIRIWVLYTHQLKVYWFKNGYLRTSSQIYSTESTSLKDSSVHLTNNAVQKNTKNYGKFEDGNQLSFKVLQKLITNAGGDYRDLINKIKYIIKLTALSVKRKINKLDREFCFEIFGYDFMVDIHCKPWLIQVNTNPCIQQSSVLLKNLLPQMLDQAFVLTIDCIFLDSSKPPRKVEDLDWEQIVDLKK